MRGVALFFVAMSLTLTGCSKQAATPAAVPRPSVNGTYLASLAIAGKGTYTGTIELTPVGRDSVRGTVVFTSPIRVDAPVAGAVRGDSLRLSGPYSAANGCTGTIALAVSLTAMPHTGPSRLVDRCVGEMTATFTAKR
jgi:hypothetical protein